MEGLNCGGGEGVGSSGSGQAAGLSGIGGYVTEAMQGHGTEGQGRCVVMVWVQR